VTRTRLAILVLVLTLAAVVAAAPATEAHVRWYGGVYVGVGPYWWPYPYGWYPGPYYYGYPPVVRVEPPAVYVEMPPPQHYWYYCAPSQAYYPYVPTCTEPWIKVPATRE
jgi:hypothetical protein